MAYTINQNFIPGLPKIAYDGGVGNYVGVVGHATDNVGDTANGERNYESSTFNNAFVHFFVDDTQILQTADINYICFGAGHTANHKGYVQIELCETTDAAKFAKAYAQYTWLLAKLLFDKKLPVQDGVTLMSHKQVSNTWHETTHEDPIEYLAKFGKTWANVVADVTANYNAMGVKKVKNIVVFNNVVDKRAAEYLADSLGCATIDGSITFDYTQVENVYGVGGGTFTANAKVVKGNDRYDTVIAVLKQIGKL